MVSRESKKIMRPTMVLLVVGLTPRHLGPLTPNITRLASAGAWRPLATVTPAVTCSVQATFMTGTQPRSHGAVANGWLFRDLMEVWFWRQSNRLIEGEKIWEAGKRRDPRFTCANLFWWYNMAATHDIGLTPRPQYRVDGRKLPDCYAVPASLREELTALLGAFPLFQFWGPATDISSSRWIAEATKHVVAQSAPSLTLVYLPHLDYDLQRHGPDESHPRVAASLREIDGVAGDLIDFAQTRGCHVIVLSEYGMSRVDTPIHINRALREAGLLGVRCEDGRELLDPATSRAFAVADHQIAHIYVEDDALTEPVRRIVRQLAGVEEVLDRQGQKGIALDHPRSGELVALAARHAWFTYYYWLDDARAPDFARTVEIHRKPGYDPVELFIDPAIRFPKLAVGARLAKRWLGQRAVMDVIPLDASLVRGSHGRADLGGSDGPIFITSDPRALEQDVVSAVDVKRLVLSHVFSDA